MARRTPGAGRVQALALLAVAAPFLVLVAALGTRVGAWPVEVGYDLLTMRVGWFAAFFGAAAALGALFLSLGNFRKSGVLAIAAVLPAAPPPGALPADLPPGLELVVAAAPPVVTFPIMGCLDDRGRLFIGDAAGLNLDRKGLEAKLPNRVLMLEDRDGDGVIEPAEHIKACPCFDARPWARRNGFPAAA